MASLYSPLQLEDLARKAKFIRRKSKLTASMYLDLLLFNVFDNEKISLNDHSVELRSSHGVQIRKQSIHERFNEGSVAFLRTLFEHQLQTAITRMYKVPVLEHFTAVMIKDSTRFQLPANLKMDYPSSGGSASGAGMHIQFEFDLCSGKVNDFNLTDALYHDTKDALQTVHKIQEGSLLLRDLGYFSTQVLEQIEQANAYYISRLNPQIKIYQRKGEDYVLLNLNTIYQQMKISGITHKELNVCIGSERKVPVRLIIEPLPEQEVAKRIAKARKTAGKHRRTLSESFKTNAALNLFVTNAPESKLPSDQVRMLYRLRWQIELRFKTWKSFWRIHRIKKMNVHRFQTYLYACLLLIFISWEISNNLTAIVWQHTKRLLSIIKCFKAIVTTQQKLKEALFNPRKLPGYLENLYALSGRELRAERRKTICLRKKYFPVEC